MADRRLQVFYAVARQLSFTKAAEQVFMTQPAVTFQVKQLEEYFNTRLFDRSRGKIALTLAGQLVLEYAETIHRAGTEMLDVLQNQPVEGRREPPDERRGNPPPSGRGQARAGQQVAVGVNDKCWCSDGSQMTCRIVGDSGFHQALHAINVFVQV